MLLALTYRTLHTAHSIEFVLGDTVTGTTAGTTPAITILEALEGLVTDSNSALNQLGGIWNYLDPQSLPTGVDFVISFDGDAKAAIDLADDDNSGTSSQAVVKADLARSLSQAEEDCLSLSQSFNNFVLVDQWLYEGTMACSNRTASVAAYRAVQDALVNSDSATRTEGTITQFWTPADTSAGSANAPALGAIVASMAVLYAAMA